ncbi:MAG: ferrochelatase [Alphaproteobacteria bacterium]|nr:ferrochelatase [Alphaproteobacteria bacterium]
MKKIAVVLYNMGGPKDEKSIRRFLYNLFNDPAIIGLPIIMRQIIAFFISTLRARSARKIYAKLGGKSPILENTMAQAIKIEKKLSKKYEARCFVAMRYSGPRIKGVMEEIKKFKPDAIIQVPLYPQFSFATTGSSLREFSKLADKKTRVCTIKDYPVNNGFINSITKKINSSHERAIKHGRPILILSAHGLPEKNIRAGDPYQGQCERTAKAIINGLKNKDIDWRLCYQSRLGPLKWIGPETSGEIKNAAINGRPIIVAPISFVSECSETLVELGVEYRGMAAMCGAPFYEVVPAPGTDSDFIGGLVGLINEKVESLALVKAAH